MAKAIADILMKGWDVMIPVSSTSPFDLVIYRNGVFLRVQVKYRTPSNGVLHASSRRSSITGRKAVHRHNDEVDILCVYDGENDRCYYVPAQKGQISLRVSPARNNQTTGTRPAELFTEIPI